MKLPYFLMLFRSDLDYLKTQLGMEDGTSYVMCMSHCGVSPIRDRLRIDEASYYRELHVEKYHSLFIVIITLSIAIAISKS